MPQPPQVSAVLFANHSIDQQIQDFQQAGIDAEFLVVTDDRAEEQYQSPQTTASGQPELLSFSNASAAIEAASRDTVAILDPEFRLTKPRWDLLAERIVEAPIQMVTCPAKPSTWIGRAVVWVYRCIVWLTLGANKSQLDVGMLLCCRSELNHLLPELATARQQPGFSESFQLTALLALARLQKKDVVEIRDDFSSRDHDVAKPMPNVNAMWTCFANTMRFWWNTLMFPKKQHELELNNPTMLWRALSTMVLVMVACFVFLGALDHPLFEPDEARNAQLAINVVESGNWLSLKLENEYYWDKPPLQIWAIACSYRLFGPSPFATRLPVAMAGLATILMTLVLGARIVGFRAAWLGAFLLLLTAGFVFTGRYVTMDASLTTMVTVVMLLGCRLVTQHRTKCSLFAMGVAAGVGVLVKGPVIAVLCGPPLLVAMWLSNHRDRAVEAGWRWMLIPMVVIAAPWFIAMAIVHPDFLLYFFWKHHVVRFSNAFNHHQPFWYYLPGIFLFMFPASYLLPSVAKFMVSARPENRLLRGQQDGVLWLAAIWIFGFFSMSQSKLPTYIVPSFPLICLLMGAMLERKVFARLSGKLAKSSVLKQVTFLEKLEHRIPIRLAAWLVVFGIVAACVLPTMVQPWSVWIGLTAVLCVLACLASWNWLGKYSTWACSGLLGISVIVFGAHWLTPAISSSRSIVSAARMLQNTDEFEHAPIAYYGRERYGSGLSLDSNQVFFFDEMQTGALVEFLVKHPTAILVSSEEPMERLRMDLPWTIELEERTGARHLYTARPNRPVIARQAESLVR